MLIYFRGLSLFEGMSYLLILCVSIDVISRDLVYVIGMTHGFLFIAYFVLSLITSHKQNWSVIVWALIFLASIVPFAFLPVEAFLKKELRRNNEIK